MIYFVSNTQDLFERSVYKCMTVSESLEILDKYNSLQFDIETTGLDPHIDSMLCAQFGTHDKEYQIVVDTSTIDLNLYKSLLESKLLIGHNLKFDLTFLYSLGITPRNVFDTMIVEQLLYLGYPYDVKNYGLSDVLFDYFGTSMDKSIRSQIAYRGLDESVIEYAANDVLYLHDLMQKQLIDCRKKDCLKAAKLECDFVPVISYLEWCGIKLDEEKWKAKMVKDQSKKAETKEILDKFCIDIGNSKFISVNRQGDLFEGFDAEPKCTINWGSSTQVVKFAQFLGFDTKVTDKKTGESKESVIEKHLKGQKGINDTFLKVYFNYQEAAKVCSTYGQSYLNAINPKTGRIHTKFKQIGASSGRMSCGSSKEVNVSLARLKGLPTRKPANTDLYCGYPQLQNLPSDEETRGAFVCEPNNFFCSADYAALESRLGADIYNEVSMLEEFLHGSGDMHSLCAKMVYTKELEGIDVKDVKKLRPDLRKDVKAIEFSQQFNY